MLLLIFTYLYLFVLLLYLYYVLLLRNQADTNIYSSQSKRHRFRLWCVVLGPDPVVDRSLWWTGPRTGPCGGPVLGPDPVGS